MLRNTEHWIFPQSYRRVVEKPIYDHRCFFFCAPMKILSVETSCWQCFAVRDLHTHTHKKKMFPLRFKSSECRFRIGYDNMIVTHSEQKGKFQTLITSIFSTSARQIECRVVLSEKIHSTLRPKRSLLKILTEGDVRHFSIIWQKGVGSYFSLETVKPLVGILCFSYGGWGCWRILVKLCEQVSSTGESIVQIN